MSEYLVNPKSAPYMILAFDTTEKREQNYSGIHPWDKTCRPQTLTQIGIVITLSCWKPSTKKLEWVDCLTLLLTCTGTLWSVTHCKHFGRWKTLNLTA